MTYDAFEGFEAETGDGDAAAPAVRIPITIKHHDTPPEEVEDLSTASEPVTEGRPDDAFFVVNHTTTTTDAEAAAIDPYRNFDFTVETGGDACEGDEDDGSCDIIVDPDATEETRAADGPHQGRRDIGGYVPTNIVVTDADQHTLRTNGDLLLCNNGDGSDFLKGAGTDDLIGEGERHEVGSLPDIPIFSIDDEDEEDAGSLDLARVANEAELDMIPDINLPAQGSAPSSATRSTEDGSAPYGHYTQVVWAETSSTPADAYVVPNDAKIATPNDGVHDSDADYRQPPPTPGYEQIIYGTPDDDELVGGSGGEMIFGFEGNDLIHGGGGDDLIAGYYNFNTLYGNQGDDIVVGGIDNDDLFGGFGNDDLRGESGNDFLAGNEDHDFLSGGDGDDELFGGEGHDVLAGGLGLDELTGGSGIDVFRWGHASEDDGGKDTITDFEVGIDHFQFVTAWGEDSFFDASLGGSVSDLLLALDNGNHTELLANTATDGWTVIADLLNTDHDAIQQRIDDGSILYDYGEAVFDAPDVFLS